MILNYEYFSLLEITNGIIALINKDYSWGNFGKDLLFPNLIGFLKTPYKSFFSLFFSPKSTTFSSILSAAHYSLTNTLGLKPLLRRES